MTNLFQQPVDQQRDYHAIQKNAESEQAEADVDFMIENGELNFFPAVIPKGHQVHEGEKSDGEDDY